MTDTSLAEQLLQRICDPDRFQLTVDTTGEVPFLSIQGGNEITAEQLDYLHSLMPPSDG